MSGQLIDTLNESYKGFLKIEKVRETDNVVVQTINVKNIITYTATNLMSRSLAGDTRYNISTFRVGGKVGAASVPAGTADRGDTALAVLTDYSGDDPEIVEFAAISPAYAGEASANNGDATLQYNNIVTFTGIMPATGSFDGKHFHEAGIFAKVGDEYIMFAHQFHTPIEKETGFNLVYTWSFKFL